MKKIIFSLLAAAALAACTKTDVTYDAPAEIGFNVVGGNITKAPVDGTTFPSSLNMYVNAYVNATNVPTTPDYINKGEFTYLSTYGTYDATDNEATENEKATNVWGGGSSSNDRNPYYWPNEQTLHFSGFSKAGNVAELLDKDVTYNPSEDKLTINDYRPGTETDKGVNDLMWFPSTKYAAETGYGKATKYVPVNMYHTCAWITFLVQGDQVTGNSESSYTITSLTMNGVDQTANVVCTGNKELQASTLSNYVVWSSNKDQSGEGTTLYVSVNTSGVELKGTYTAGTDGAAATQTPINIETGETAATGGNIVVIPQKPGTIDLSWTYSSSTNASITDTAKNLSLKITTDETDSDNVWKPGKHYIYTITIKANEILVAPTPFDWTSGNSTVTVE